MTQMQSVDFMETGFIGQMGFFTLQYLATNNGLPCNNKSCFQGNVVKVS
jgi:hypothetical protein